LNKINIITLFSLLLPPPLRGGGARRRVDDERKFLKFSQFFYGRSCALRDDDEGFGHMSKTAVTHTHHHRRQLPESGFDFVLKAHQERSAGPSQLRLNSFSVLFAFVESSRRSQRVTFDSESTPCKGLLFATIAPHFRSISCSYRPPLPALACTDATDESICSRLASCALLLTRLLLPPHFPPPERCRSRWLPLLSRRSGSPPPLLHAAQLSLKVIHCRRPTAFAGPPLPQKRLVQFAICQLNFI
jgi:hypothetical protein